MGSCINPARKSRPNGQLHLAKLKGRLARKPAGVCGRVARANQRGKTVNTDNLHLPKRRAARQLPVRVEALGLSSIHVRPMVALRPRAEQDQARPQARHERCQNAPTAGDS